MRSTSPPQPRADARRNREALLAAARAAFAETDATVPLETVAREAGVGIGTLYRHFPTREALVEAVYATELGEVVECVPGLLAQLDPVPALRAWMDRYAEFVATKRGMIDTLREGWASGRIAPPTTRARITAAIALMLAAGASDQTLRSDVHPDDVTAMLLGVFLSSPGNERSEQTDRLLDLLLDGLRPRG